MTVSGINKKQLTESFEGEHLQRIEDVYFFAEKHLSDLPRRSKESYFQHGCEVAYTLLELSHDPTLIVSCLLHDLLVHENGDELLDKSPLNDHERALVRKMHGLRRLHISKNMKDLDQVIEVFSNNSAVLMMRMAHRLNDVRNLDRFKGELKRKIANESLNMYTAIAGRLGFNAWKTEMEDSCFEFLFPNVAEQIRSQLDLYKPVDEACLEHTRDYLLQKFEECGINAQIEYRLKELYSCYRKMSIKNRGLGELTDRLALRIVVDNRDDCYRALGVVHNVMHPVPGKLKDYIGAPKENGYRSIHTVVFPLPDVSEQAIEIQIRTYDMHYECEYGVAAHHDYKEDVGQLLQAKPVRVNLFRNLEVLKKEVDSPEQFGQLLRNYFREDQVLIFDEDNNVYHLKRPARARDFISLIDADKHGFPDSVRVNGRKRDVDTVLNDGDVVSLG